MVVNRKCRGFHRSGLPPRRVTTTRLRERCRGLGDAGVKHAGADDATGHSAFRHIGAALALSAAALVLGPSLMGSDAGAAAAPSATQVAQCQKAATGHGVLCKSGVKRGGYVGSRQGRRNLLWSCALGAATSRAPLSLSVGTIVAGGVTTTPLLNPGIQESYPQISGPLVSPGFVNPDTKGIVARAVGGTAVGLAAAWAAGRIFRGVPRAGLATLLVVALAHQEFDSRASDWVYKQLR